LGRKAQNIDVESLGALRIAGWQLDVRMSILEHEFAS
jgi:hypothetical protein